MYAVVGVFVCNENWLRVETEQCMLTVCTKATSKSVVSMHESLLFVAG